MEILRQAGYEARAVEDVAGAVKTAEQWRRGEGWIFVTGSLFTVGAARVAFGDPVEHAAHAHRRS
jgi:hypothetical protein